MNNDDTQKACFAAIPTTAPIPTAATTPTAGKMYFGLSLMDRGY